MPYIKELKVTYKRKRVADDLLNRPVENPGQVYALFKDMENEIKEKVVVLHLNPQLEILSYELATIGTADRALFDAVEIYRNAMLARASRIILVHNHPSGDCKPSKTDIRSAKKLNELGKIHEMPLQDFIIIGHDEYFSFSEQGRL